MQLCLDTKSDGLLYQLRNIDIQPFTLIPAREWKGKERKSKANNHQSQKEDSFCSRVISSSSCWFALDQGPTSFDFQETRFFRKSLVVLRNFSAVLIFISSFFFRSRSSISKEVNPEQIRTSALHFLPKIWQFLARSFLALDFPFFLLMINVLSGGSYKVGALIPPNSFASPSLAQLKLTLDKPPVEYLMLKCGAFLIFTFAPLSFEQTVQLLVELRLRFSYLFLQLSTFSVKESLISSEGMVQMECWEFL